MAKNQGYLAKIGADTSELESAIKGIQNSTKTITSELNKVNKALKMNPESTVLQAQKMELLKQQAEKAEQELQKLAEAKRTMENVKNSGTEEGIRCYREYEREIESCRNAINAYKNAQAEANKVTEQVSGATDEATGALQQATKGTSGWADVLKGNLLSDAIIGGLEKLVGLLLDVGKQTIEVGKTFDTSMSNVAATMGIDKASEEYNALAVAAQHMGATTKFTAAESADALNYLALAGYDAKTAIAALPNVLTLAQAGGMDLAATSDMITDSMSALGLVTADMSEEMKSDAMQKFADEMAVASQKANTSVAQLGEGILTVGASAQGLKGGTVELNTMLGALADIGIKGAEGGTHIRNIIKTFKDGADDFKEIGVDVYDLNGNLNALPDIVEQFKQSLNGLSNEEKDAKILELFNSTDLAAINGLLGTTSERYAELSGYIEDSAGAAQKMADTMNDNLEGAIASCNSAWEGFLGTIYTSISEDMQGAVEEVAALLGEMNTGLTEGNMSAEQVDALMQKLSDYCINFANNLSTTLNKLGMEIIPQMLEGINKNIGNVANAGADVVYVLVKGLLNNLPLILDGALKLIEGFCEGIGENLPELIPAVIDIIGQIVVTLVDHIPEIQKAAYTIIEGLYKGLVNQETFTKLGEAVVNIVMSIISSFGEILFNFFDLGVSIISTIIQGIEDFDFEKLCNDLGYNLCKAIDDGFNSYNIEQDNKKVDDLRNYTKEQLEQMRVDLSDEQVKIQQAWKEFTESGTQLNLEDWINSYTIKSANQVALNSMLQKAKKEGMTAAEYYAYYYGTNDLTHGDYNETTRQMNRITDVLQSGDYKKSDEVNTDNKTSTTTNNTGNTGYGADYGARVAGEAYAREMQRKAKEAAQAVKFDEEKLTEEMDKLDHQLAIHAMTEDEYYAERQKVLNTYTDKTNETWWKYQDEVTAYYNKQAEDQKALNEKQKADSEKALQDEAKAQEKAWKDRLSDIKDTIKKGKANKDSAIVSSAVAELQTLLAEINADSDVYKDCVDAIEDGKEDIANIESTITKESTAKRLSDIEFNKKVLERSEGELTANKRYFEDLKQFVEDIEGSEYFRENAQSLQEKLWNAEDNYNKSYIAAYKSDIENQIEKLEEIRDDFEDSALGDKWYAEQLQAIIDNIDDVDVAGAFADKLKKANDTVLKNAEDAEKAVKQASEKYRSSIEIFRNGTDLQGNDASIINDLDKQRVQVEKITEGINKLKERNVSQEFIDTYITPLSISDGSKQNAISALLGLSDKQLQQEMDDYEKLKQSYVELAKAENSDSVNEIEDSAVTAADSALSKAIEQAYKTGIDTAGAFNKGIIDGLNNSGTLNAQTALTAQGIKTTNSTATLTNSTTAQQQAVSGNYAVSGTNIDNLTVSVSVAGTEIIKKTIKDFLRDNKITQGNNTGL